MATVTVQPASASHFLITAPLPSVSGMPFDVIVTALDPYGNMDTNYHGTIAFSTSDPDPGVVLPTVYTFTTGSGGDSGVHVFLSGVTLMTPGVQTITATDTASGISGSATITVNTPAPPSGGGASNTPKEATLISGLTALTRSGYELNLVDRLFASVHDQQSLSLLSLVKPGDAAHGLCQDIEDLTL